LVSNLEMSNFFAEQGRTRVYDEAYRSYVEEVNPRRTQLSTKRAISGRKLIKAYITDSGNLEGEKNEVRRDRV
jgi:hypothetical protein